MMVCTCFFFIFLVSRFSFSFSHCASSMFSSIFFFAEMVEFMKKLAEHETKELTVEERNLLSVAYKNVVGARRTSWRVLHLQELKELQKVTSLPTEAARHKEHAELAKMYRQRIEVELMNLCNEVLQLLNRYLLPISAAGSATAVTAELGQIIEKSAHDSDNFRAIEDYLQSSLAASSLVLSITSGEILVFYYKMSGHSSPFCFSFFSSAPVDLPPVALLCFSFLSFFV